MIERLSVSNLSTYSRCPKQFHYRVVEKRTEPAVGVLMLGSSVHAAIEAFVKNKVEGRPMSPTEAAEVAADELRKRIKKVLDAGDHIEWASDKRSGWMDTTTTAIRDAAALAELWCEKVGAVEEWKGAEISEGIPLHPEDTRLRLTGRMDLVRADGLIVEIKTGGSAWSEGAEDLESQAVAYPLLKGLAEVPVSIRFDVLIRNVKAKTKPATYELDQRGPFEVPVRRQVAYLDDARQHAAGIQMGLFPRRIGKHCGWCSFRSECF